MSSLILAISGGPDSVYLLHWLLERGHRPILAHLNHQQRGEKSDADARFVETLAAKHGLPCEIATEDVKTWARHHKKSLEEAGRLLRYRFFEKIRLKHRADRIVTAHHLNDNLETVLMNRERGCGRRGEIGMREYDSVRHLWRPLLNTPKSKILAYLKKHEIPYRIDATNRDQRFTRNRIRLQTIPALLEKDPNLLKNFQKTRQQALLQYENLKQWAREWLTDDSFELAAFQKLTSEKQSFLLQHIYEETYGSTQNLTRGQIQQVVKTTRSSQTGKQKKLGPQLTFRIEYGRVQWNPAKPSRRKTATLAFDAQHIPQGKILQRTWQPGDRFQPSGMRGTKKLQDYFTDGKIPRAERHRTPVLTTTTDQIIAVGTRVDERFRAVDSTKKILHFKVAI